MDIQSRRLESLLESIQAKEKHQIGLARASGSSESLCNQYSIIDIAQLFDLMTWYRDGCKSCGEKLYVVGTEWKGHCLEMALQCGACGNSDIWSGSHIFEDGSAQVNRDVVRAWYTTGGEDCHYQHFASELRVGIYNQKSYDSTVDLLIPLILEQEDKMYSINISKANENKDGAIIGIDVQNCRPQRATGSAPLATATVINHTPGQQYGQILIQTHLYKYDMIQKGIKPTASKDKLATEEALKILSVKLDKIKRGICDGIGSTNTIWKSAVVGEKHKQPILSYCGWHKAKNLAKDFKIKLLEHKTKLKKKKGNQQYKLSYPEFDEFGITGAMMKAQWIRAQKKSEENVDDVYKVIEMRMQWLRVLDFFESQAGPFSKKTQEAFSYWLEKQSSNLDRYVHGDLTDLEEAFHRTGLKYWKKGKSYSKGNYVARRALAAMHWNENYGKKEGQQLTYNFLSDIKEKFGKYLKSRTKGRNADNSINVQKSGVITHWV